MRISPEKTTHNIQNKPKANNAPGKKWSFRDLKGKRFFTSALYAQSSRIIQDSQRKQAITSVILLLVKWRCYASYVLDSAEQGLVRFRTRRACASENSTAIARNIATSGNTSRGTFRCRRCASVDSNTKIQIPMK